MYRYIYFNHSVYLSSGTRTGKYFVCLLAQGVDSVGILLPMRPDAYPGPEAHMHVTCACKYTQFFRGLAPILEYSFKWHSMANLMSSSSSTRTRGLLHIQHMSLSDCIIASVNQPLISHFGKFLYIVVHGRLPIIYRHVWLCICHL